MTATRYAGFLKTLGGAATGLEAGDKLCQTAGAAANLGGSWRAWLSAFGPGLAGPGTHAVDRIAEVGPWHRLDGVKVFDNKVNLMTSPLAPLEVDEHGRRLPPDSVQVWTGTTTGGRASGNACDAWTVGVDARQATVGHATAQDQRWSESGVVACGTDLRLYCLEQ